MFRKRKPPIRQFVHAEGCPILKADPNCEILWSYVGDGSWRAECVCTFESYTQPIVDTRERLDPLDPKTSRHAPECEYVSERDPAVLRVLLKIRPGAGGGYDWVECGSCDTAWQVPYYAESVG